MGKVIDSDNLDKHHVKKFQFATIAQVDNNKSAFDQTLFSATSTDIEEPQEDNEEETSRPSNQEADALLQKIEYLSGENIRLETELESLQKRFDEEIAKAREEAFEKGKVEGIQETQVTFQEHNDTHNTQLIKSITSLEEAAQRVEAFLDASKEELIEASGIIAEKIIKKELEEHSHIVAKKLADSFINDLKEASTITLKVNPQDAHYIEEAYKERKKIIVDADDAINKGGIIILSDIGNIDGNIDTRVQKAIALIKREG